MSKKFLLNKKELVATITSTYDLEELWFFMHCYEVDKKLQNATRRIACDHVRLSIRKILLKIESLYELGEIYSDRYWEEQEFGPKIIARMKTLYKESSLENLLVFRKKGSCRRGVACTAFKVPLEIRIVELVQMDKRRTQFPFLLDVWKALIDTSGESNTRECLAKIEALMPDALKSQNNPVALYGWYYNDTFNKYWNHWGNRAAQAVLQRLHHVIEKKLPTTVDVKVLMKFCFPFSKNVSLSAKADVHMAQIVRTTTARMNSKQKKNYKNQFGFQSGLYWPQTMAVFSK